MKIAVVGAHLSGLPLNGQLVDRGGRLLFAARTSRYYRLYELPQSTPAKPGMVRVAERGERGIEVEVWELDPAAFGEFVGLVPPPLCIGNVELEDGQWVKGFLAETYALVGAKEITVFGGWRNYLQNKHGEKQ